jgi:hypothetical protein
MMVLDKMLDDFETGSCCRCVMQQRVSSADKETGMVKRIAHAYIDSHSTHRAHALLSFDRSLSALCSLSLSRSRLLSSAQAICLSNKLTPCPEYCKYSPAGAVRKVVCTKQNLAVAPPLVLQELLLCLELHDERRHERQSGQENKKGEGREQEKGRESERTLLPPQSNLGSCTCLHVRMRE